MEVCNKENLVTSPWRGDGKKDDPDLQHQRFIPSCTRVEGNSAALGLGENRHSGIPTKKCRPGKANVPGIPGHKRDGSLDPAPSLEELKQSPK